MIKHFTCVFPNSFSGRVNWLQWNIK